MNPPSAHTLDRDNMTIWFASKRAREATRLELQARAAEGGLTLVCRTDDLGFGLEVQYPDDDASLDAAIDLIATAFERLEQSRSAE